jgi:Fic family protein
VVEPNKAGIRKLPGTVIGDSTGNVIYEPPQHSDEIVSLLSNLVSYINDNTFSNLDPLIKMAITHHQFESIHPFYDGNGRTGRIINILLLVKNDLLDLPILYLSRYIVRTKNQYYDLLQSVRINNNWEAWILYMLEGIAVTAKETIVFVMQIRELVAQTKNRLRNDLPKIYSQELLNNLFFHPYTKVQFVVDQLGVTRITAAKYLNELAAHGFVTRHKVGRVNYYENDLLVELIKQQEANEFITP